MGNSRLKEGLKGGSLFRLFVLSGASFSLSNDIYDRRPRSVAFGRHGKDFSPGGGDGRPQPASKTEDEQTNNFFCFSGFPLLTIYNYTIVLWRFQASSPSFLKKLFRGHPRHVFAGKTHGPGPISGRALRGSRPFENFPGTVYSKEPVRVRKTAQSGGKKHGK